MSQRKARLDILQWWHCAEQSPHRVQHANRVMEWFALPFREAFLASPFDAPTFTERANRFCGYLHDCCIDTLEQVVNAPFPEDRNLPLGCDRLLRCAKIACYRAASEETAARQVIACSALYLLGITDPGIGLLLVLAGDTNFAWMVAHYARRHLSKWLREEHLPLRVEVGDIFNAAAEFRDSALSPLGAVRKSVLENHSRPPAEELLESQLALPEGSPSPLERAVAAEPTPEQLALLEEVESTPDLSQLLASLKEQDRLLLATITGEHTEEEVADLLGVSISALRKRRQRLIHNLRERLAV